MQKVPTVIPSHARSVDDGATARPATLQRLAGRGYAALGRLIAPVWLARSAG